MIATTKRPVTFRGQRKNPSGTINRANRALKSTPDRDSARTGVRRGSVTQGRKVRGYVRTAKRLGWPRRRVDPIFIQPDTGLKFSPRTLSISSIRTMADVVANGSPTLKLSKVTFKGGWDMVKDTGGGYTGPHWDASRSPVAYPYLYRRS